MRNVVWLVSGYVVVSMVTVAAMVVFRDDPALVTDAVWVRGTLVALASVVTRLFAAGAARGNPRMLRRLRLVTTIMLVVIVVIVALPGAFPLWFRLEQGVCGLLLLPVVVQVNRRSVTQSRAS